MLAVNTPEKGPENPIADLVVTQHPERAHLVLEMVQDTAQENPFENIAHTARETGR